MGKWFLWLNDPVMAAAATAVAFVVLYLAHKHVVPFLTKKKAKKVTIRKVKKIRVPTPK